MENLTSVILCAGEGKRAKGIADDLPKPLIKVESLKNQSILSILISHLYKFGIKPIVLVTGYLSEQIEKDILSSQAKNPYKSERIIINNAGDRYKLGPLHSFLSITRNKRVFKTNKLFLVIPGDTIFDYKLMEEVLNVLKENYAEVNQNSIVFYRRTTKLALNKETEKFGLMRNKMLSCVRTKEKGSKQYVKEIYQRNIKTQSVEEEFNHIIPMFIITYDYVKNFENLASKTKLNKIVDAVNSSIKNEMEFLACRVKSDQKFYDIDTALDLTFVNRFYKKGGQ
ncbi:MAG: NTP transferase domain-containing protein [Candidatus Lokiarchaeota archaeon]|nr:NTP transferase domain-containing protein [Candidatus Lokiarchaeota archaeon]